MQSLENFSAVLLHRDPVDMRKYKSKPAFHVLQLIKGLDKIETEIKDKSIEDRFKIRQEQAKPILDKIKAWLDANQNNYPSGLMGKAITYATNQWISVTNYLLDGRLDIDNKARTEHGEV